MASNRLLVLRKHKEFDDIKSNGSRVRLGGVLLFCYLANSYGALRVGWTVPSKVGTAVKRNRFKRWCREYFKSLNSQEKQLSFDVNIVFLNDVSKRDEELKYEEFKQLMQSGIKRLAKNA